MASKSIFSIDSARDIVGRDRRLLVTGHFIPAQVVHALANVMISHGGQGRMQCVLAAGKPIAGVALQVEQQTNPDNAISAGAVIRVQRQYWEAKSICSAVFAVLREISYAANAKLLAETLSAMDGANSR